MKQAAHTKLNNPYPAYINVRADDHDDLIITVRSEANENAEGSQAQISLSRAEFEQLMQDVREI